MINIHVPPLFARRLFEWREAINAIVACVVFAVLFLLLREFFGGFLSGVAAIVAAFFLYFFGQVGHFLTIKCSNPECGKLIDSRTPWFCGNKGCRNDNVDEFPFIYRCEHCGVFPKAYRCHHCKNFIFLTEDEQSAGCAECANRDSKGKSVRRREDFQDKTAEKRDEIELAKLKVAQAELKAQEKEIRRRAKEREVKIRTPQERLMEILHAAVHADFAALEAKKWVEQTFKDDELTRKKLNIVIEKFVRGEIK